MLKRRECLSVDLQGLLNSCMIALLIVKLPNWKGEQTRMVTTQDSSDAKSIELAARHDTAHTLPLPPSLCAIWLASFVDGDSRELP